MIKTAALVIWLQKNANSAITGSMEIIANRVVLRKEMVTTMIIVVSQQIHQLKHQQKPQVLSYPTSQVQPTHQCQAKFQHRNQVKCQAKNIHSLQVVFQQNVVLAAIDKHLLCLEMVSTVRTHLNFNQSVTKIHGGVITSFVIGVASVLEMDMRIITVASHPKTQARLPVAHPQAYHHSNHRWSNPKNQP